MSNIDKRALREELSNPAIGSNAHLRKLALALLDELEAKDKRIAEIKVTAFNPALLDVISERQRQRAIEGWTSEHDDKYEHGELADAAGCYALSSELFECVGEPPRQWPWSDEWWKPTNRRRDLVKAGALILAEIERLDRTAAAGKGE
ncbi:hypothetical protein [Enterobacter cloacae complex sp. FDA-CDC-AR_0164]|uniref:hypothetical protein n=1 Tax=Enterobacter cloacae complex sp. FDA-CDC-AR_0164 TaxID=2077136 RepID=UPI000D3EBEC4|nr:hypothetical protein [Enterobacter cloacae complex sp. FDA-CDC-AR_0164]AWC85773.1 hypothetical protein AM410_15605 [Enterobacter cloacae complex sp. FDA-CDC-AR_0164]